MRRRVDDLLTKTKLIWPDGFFFPLRYDRYSRDDRHSNYTNFILGTIVAII